MGSLPDAGQDFAISFEIGAMLETVTLFHEVTANRFQRFIKATGLLSIAHEIRSPRDDVEYGKGNNMSGEFATKGL